MAKDRKTLSGKKILVTRPRAQATEFIARLQAAGAEVVALPTIAIVDPPDWGPADRAITALERYRGLLLTSVNGVKRFFRRLSHHGLDAAALAHLETIAVGPKTAQTAAADGLECHQVAKEYAGEGILELLSGRNLEGFDFLFPRALEAREIVPETLRQQGARVDIVPVYQTIFPPESATRLHTVLSDDRLDFITLTSASTATNLVRHCPPEELEKLRRIPAVCIGPITATAARKAGLDVRATATDYTTEGLLAALLQTAAGRNP
jgi:uroporphyrinogen III methyltransferase/synthase